MGNSLVAVDAGFFTLGKKCGMHFHRAPALPCEIHGVQVVAIAAFEGVVRLQPGPFVLRELKAFIDKFFTGIDRTKNLSPHLFGRLHLPGNFVCPVVRHMTVRARGAHTRTIAVVNCWLQFNKHVFPHLMTAGAKFFRVGDFQRGIESAPENDPGDKATHGEEAQ